MRNELREWEAVATALVSLFRYDFAAFGTDSSTASLIRRLQDASPLFCKIWNAQHVTSQLHGVWHVDHPKMGRVALEPMTYSITAHRGLRAFHHTLIRHSTPNERHSA